MWQPIPAPTSVPSGALTELLCGQPEQKNGARCAIGRGWLRAAISSSVRMRASTESIRTLRPSRAATTLAIESASSSSVSGRSSAPCSSRLPTTRGVCGPP